jgi:hypothetical protein
MLEKAKLKKLRLNISVSNAFLLHSDEFKGYDPESATNANQFGQNIFFFDSPRSRNYSLGLNVSF